MQNEEDLTDEELEEIGKDMERAVDSRNPMKFRRLLEQLGVDPDGKIGRKRMAAFYRACNLDIP